MAGKSKGYNFCGNPSLTRNPGNWRNGSNTVVVRPAAPSAGSRQNLRNEAREKIFQKITEEYPHLSRRERRKMMKSINDPARKNNNSDK